MPLPPSAASKPLSLGGAGALPFVGDAMQGWWQPMTFELIGKTILDHAVIETKTRINFRGVRQPLSPQQLAIKPEGQRAWKWQMIHAEPSLQLKNDDVIYYNGVRYRVMNRSDYTEYGYMYYEIVQDYATATMPPSSITA
jgi:hypothetical protein